MVINRINATMVSRGDMLTQNDVNELLAIDLIGLIPEDENVIISTNKGSPIAFDEKAKAGRAFRNLAARVEGEIVPFSEIEEKESFIGRFKKIFWVGGRSLWDFGIKTMNPAALILQRKRLKFVLVHDRTDLSISDDGSNEKRNYRSDFPIHRY